ncbi:AfsR/SARP family transcriptional regulator [Plantactinospora sp. S1510]|uniref:AfsR/SARP family transcriptional regulator n=1 Tax=Plantactinospora alkalitolerans TaxID=2789879 RepID=A0ABS0GQ91_9ACTN|nr:AfsR/SARP family transcriptional regulator [Plantactinospora alkalitolerans]MBF9128219.1 AfsR/SARP family transcriptional regulator [Plantactinospora alkalitolerans]
MRYRLLGPPEISGPEGRTWFRSHRQRAVFAALALNANHVVTVERLIDVVWPQNPPSTAQAQIHKAISALRPLLDAGGGWGGGSIDTVFPGYRLCARSGEVDADAFHRDTRDAAAWMATGRVTEAVTGYRGALDRWFGRALDGVPGLAADATFLEEHRLHALESSLCGEVLLGRRTDLAAELEQLCAGHQLRERLRALQMIVLHLCGRRAEALEVYHRTRRLLAEELGLAVGAELREVAQVTLAGEPEDHLALVARWAHAATGEWATQ